MAENNAINKQTEDLIINKAAGDPYVNFQIGGVDEFVIGVDDSDADALKLNQGGSSPSGGTTTFSMSASGEMNMPVQPAFLAYSASGQTNVTGNGGVVTIQFDTESFDQASDFNTGTYTFTTPITGRYFLNSKVLARAVGAATGVLVSLITSNATYTFNDSGNPNAASDEDQMTKVVADMDAADTAYTTLTITGLAGNTAGYFGGYAYTNIGGILLC